MKLSIKIKILLFFTATLLIATVLNLFFMSRVLKENYESALNSELFAQGNNLKSQLTRITDLGISVKDVEGFDRVCLDLVKKNEHLLEAMVIDAEGTILYHSNPAFHGRKADPVEIIQILRQNQTKIITLNKNNGDIYTAVIPLQENDEYSKYGILVSCPAAIINTKIMSLISKCNLFFLSTFGAAAFLLLVSLTQMLTKPLRAILYAIKTITASKTLEQRVDVKTNDEIGQIAIAFNNMIEDLHNSTTSIERLNNEIKIRKEAENQAYMAKREAQHANQAKGSFLANMSHEIRTPMNAIIGFSELLYEENLNEEQKKHAKIVIDNGHVLLNLINDILDFSKIEAGKLEMEKIECLLKELLESICVTMSPVASNKDVEFRLFCATDIPDCIYTDPTRLRQCLINLVNNAIKFTHQGHVYLRVFLDSPANRPTEICFVVEDTGIGIPREKIEGLFETFSQMDNSTTRKYGGTGLGLAISKQLIELMGGRISVASEAEKGSAFTIHLPFEIPDKNPPQQKVAACNQA